MSERFNLVLDIKAADLKREMTRISFLCPLSACGNRRFGLSLEILFEKVSVYLCEVQCEDSGRKNRRWASSDFYSRLCL